MRLVLISLTVSSAVVGVAVLALVVGAFLAPTASLLAVVGSAVWAPFGPVLLLAVLGAFGCGLAAMLAGMGRLGGGVVVVSGLGVVGAGFILTRLVGAAVAAGGTVDLVASLRLGAMDVPPPDVVETVRSVDGTELRAAIWRPAATVGPAPVIAYIHGGGFMAGTMTETAADLRWFADRGWLVVSVEYRLFRPGAPTWDKAPADVACALVWIDRTAARFGGDPARLALLGDSAGGNLAINAGFAAAAGRTGTGGAGTGGAGTDGAGTGGAGTGCAGTGWAEAMPVPRAIVVQYPAVDPLSIHAEGFPIPGFEPQLLVEGYIGGSPRRYPERVAAIASATHLTPEAPPTLILLPERDSLVVARGTLEFAEAAEAAGVELELVRLPFANHVFNQIAANSLGNQIGRTVRLQFLEQHVR